MEKEINKIDIYNNSAMILDSKTPSSIISWITIVIILSFLLLIVLLIPFNIYKPYYGTLNIIDGNVLFITKLEYSDFPSSKNKRLYIKNTMYNYEVVSIDDDYLKFKIDLDDNLKVNGKTLIINILEDRTNLINIILKKLKKGFDL